MVIIFLLIKIKGDYADLKIFYEKFKKIFNTFDIFLSFKQYSDVFINYSYGMSKVGDFLSNVDIKGNFIIKKKNT
jgi:hypothetical protein